MSSQSQAEAVSQRTRAKQRHAAVAANFDLIDGNFPVPDETKVVMDKARTIISDAGKKVEKLAYTVAHDTGRLIATAQILEQAKDVYCHGLILPHHPKNNLKLVYSDEEAE